MLEVLEDRTVPVQFTWTGATSAAWSTPTNWSGGVTPTGPSIELIFPTNALRFASTNDIIGLSVDSVAFGDAAYVISGQQLTVVDSMTAANQAGNDIDVNLPINLAGGASNRQLTVAAAAATVRFSQQISGAFAFHLTGPGSVEYRGTAPNINTGTTRVSNGTLQLNMGAGTAAFSGPLLVDGSGTVLWLAQQQLPANAVVTVNQGGTIALNDQADAVTSLNLSGGVVSIDGIGATLTLNGSLTASSSSTKSAEFHGAGALQVAAGARTFQVNDGPLAVDLTIFTSVTGIGGDLVKTGTGRLAFETFGSYNDTTVQQGDFEVHGEVINSLILAGGMLSGPGTVGDIVGPAAGPANGIIAPGHNATVQPFSILTASGNITLAATTSFMVDLGRITSGGAPTAGFDYDQLLVQGNASIEGAFLGGRTFAGVKGGETFTILSVIGTLAGHFYQFRNHNPVELVDGAIAFIGGVPYVIRYNAQSVTLTRLQSSAGVQLASSANPSTPGQAVTFTATVSGSGGTPTGSVTFFLDGSAAGTVSLDGAGQAALTLTTLAGGTHKIRASYSGDNSFAAAVTHNELVQVVNGSPIGTIRTSQQLGDVQRGAVLSTSQAIVQPADVNLFSFTATAGQVVRFDVAHDPSGTLDVFIRLLDASGNELAFNDDGPTPDRPFSRDASLTFRFTQDGTYFVGISGYPNFRYDPNTGAGAVDSGGSGAYALTIFIAPPERDDNDQLREARSLGAVSRARQVRDFVISSPSDVDMFRFSAAAGQRIAISVTRAPGSALAPLLRIFDARGRQVARGGASLTFVVPAGGTYFVGVSGRGNLRYSAATGDGDHAGSIGAYSLTLTPAGPGDRNAFDAAPRRTSTGSTIAGLVFFDQSADGLRQTDETGVSRHTVLIDRNNNGVRDDGERAALSNSSGQYLLDNLPAGRVFIFAAPLTQFGFTLEKVTAPPRGFHIVNLRGRRRVSNLTFGMARYLA